MLMIDWNADHGQVDFYLLLVVSSNLITMSELRKEGISSRQALRLLKGKSPVQVT